MANQLQSWVKNDPVETSEENGETQTNNQKYANNSPVQQCSLTRWQCEAGPQQQQHVCMVTLTSAKMKTLNARLSKNVITSIVPFIKNHYSTTSGLQQAIVIIVSPPPDYWTLLDSYNQWNRKGRWYDHIRNRNRRMFKSPLSRFFIAAQ